MTTTLQNQDEPDNVLPQLSRDHQVNDLPSLPATNPTQGTNSVPTTPQDGVAQIGSVDIPEEAADVDLIEKEWVDKAKQIVEHTLDDPYSQQEALSQMKAEYLKKRYNKDTGV